MADSPDGPKEDMAPLFDLVLKHVEPPKVGAGGFRMLGTLLEANPYLGRVVTGRIFSGSIKANAPVKVLDRLGNLVETGAGVEDPRLPRHRAHADRGGGGRRHRRHRRAWRNSTSPTRSAALDEVEPLQAQPIDPPTLSMTFSVNDSPLAGTEGDKVTSRVIRDRLLQGGRGQCRAAASRRRPIPTPMSSRAAANCSSPF